jgi:hypothetical protein
VHLDSKLRAEISEIADTLQGNLHKVVTPGGPPPFVNLPPLDAFHRSSSQSYRRATQTCRATAALDTANFQAPWRLSSRLRPRSRPTWTRMRRRLVKLDRLVEGGGDEGRGPRGLVPRRRCNPPIRRMSPSPSADPLPRRCGRRISLIRPSRSSASTISAVPSAPAWLSISQPPRL